LPAQAVLPPEAPVWVVREALQVSEVSDFPVVRDNKICVGFTTRARLEAALHAREADEKAGNDIEGVQLPVTTVDPMPEDNGEEQMGKLISGFVGRQSSLGGTLLPVSRLAEHSPYTILEDMPAPRLYALFSKAGARAACVVSETGEFRGMISRAGLIAATRRFEEDNDEENEDEKKDEKQDENEDENMDEKMDEDEDEDEDDKDDDKDDDKEDKPAP